MGIYEELVARGLIAQVTNEEEIRTMINAGKATFYIGFDGRQPDGRSFYGSYAYEAAPDGRQPPDSAYRRRHDHDR